MIIALVIVPVAPLAAHAASCTPQQIFDGLCNVNGNLNGDDVDLVGEVRLPGTPPTTNPDGNAPTIVDPRADCLYLLGSRCLAAGPGRALPAWPVSPVTLADIAHFRPDPGVDNMEPNGWMIVGLDTNFFSTGGVQVHDGALLGQPASVRFTPAQWHWIYGDGTSASRGTPGGTWSAQGIPEFDPTPTSHVYASPGTYYIDLTIGFRAEYRFAGMPWLPISGVLQVPANRLVATAGDAKTVLVERECTINPRGPGC